MFFVVFFLNILNLFVQPPLFMAHAQIMERLDLAHHLRDFSEHPVWRHFLLLFKFSDANL